jgi:TolA-binding protein
VHGTTFRVSAADAAGVMRTCVRVEEGVVGVLGTDGEARLEAFQSWGCDEPIADEKKVAAELGTAISRPERRAPSRSGVDPAHADPGHSERGTLDEENGLFQAGLAAERAGDARRAAASFDLLLSRYPQSPLANEARAALARIAGGTKSPR